MDLYVVGAIVIAIVAFVAGLIIDVDEFAGGVFSKFKTKKRGK